MRDLLKTSSQVCPPVQDIRYTILERIGSGSSCLVYRAECRDGQGHREIHLLKEYAPSRFTVHRASDGVMIPADDVWDAYQAGMDRFLAGVRNAIFLRRQSGLRDSICEILYVFPANGTCYLDMPISAGIVYAGVRELSIDNLLRRISTLTQVVGRIHQAGLLCLDLKPGNLLVRPEDPEHVMLFDLDSAVSKEALSQGAKLYYSQAWAPPEQKLPSLYKEICEATDLYSIGELLFYQLFRRHSRPEEHSPSASFDFRETPLLDGAGPEMRQALGKVLCKAISTSPERRYQQAGELLEALVELLAISGWERGAPGGRAAVRRPKQKSTGDTPPPSPKRDRFCPDLMYAAIDSSDYGPVRRSARLYRARVEELCGREGPEYLDVVLCEAAACFAELASSLENNAVPPSPLTGEFLRLLEEYLALAETLPSEAGPHRGSLAAFADGLRQTASLRLERCRGGEGLLGEERALLDMAMKLARCAGDWETLAELREMACPPHQTR